MKLAYQEALRTPAWVIPMVILVGFIAWQVFQ